MSRGCRQRRGPTYTSTQRNRRLEEHIGLPLLPAALSPQATIANAQQWEAFLKSDRCITRDHLRSIATWIQRTTAQPVGPNNEPAPLSSRALELQVAEILNCEETGGKAYWDIVRKGKGTRSIGWEIKLLQNRRANDVAVVASIPGSQIGYEERSSAKVVARKLFRFLAEAQESSAAEWGIDESRLLVFYGDRARNAMLVWEEPFYPSESLADGLQWSRRSRSIVGRYDGSVVWEWYPHRGQLRYSPRPPKKAPAIALPKRAITRETWQKALHNALQADGIYQELTEAQRALGSV